MSDADIPDAPLAGPFELPPLGCPTCRRVLSPDQAVFDAHFAGDDAACPSCKTQVPLWQTILEQIVEWPMFGCALVFAGARSLLVREKLRIDEVKEFDLTTHGIPPNAELLHLSLTSGGSAIPILLHGNAPHLGPLPPVFHLLGRGAEGLKGDGVLDIHAIWHEADPSDSTIRHLVDAAYEYHYKRFESVVIPANIAAESAVTAAMALALRGFASKETVTNFLEQGATYSHQLNMLVPIVAYMAGAPAMPAHLRGLLNRLRRLRNDIAHEGACVKQTQRDAAEHLTAAIFAVRYAAHLTEVLTREPLPRKHVAGARKTLDGSEVSI